MPFVKYIMKTSLPGLTQAENILADEFKKAANSIGQEGVKQIRAIQRIDTGKERSRTGFRAIQRKTQVNIEFYNTIIQAAVDETGARPHFPPYKQGSDLFRWVLRKGFSPAPSRQSRQRAASVGRKYARAAGYSKETIKIAGRVAANAEATKQTKAIESISFLIARAISRRGLPRPGDKLREPFQTFLRNSPNFAYLTFNGATGKGVSRINAAGGSYKA